MGTTLPCRLKVVFSDVVRVQMSLTYVRTAVCADNKTLLCPQYYPRLKPLEVLGDGGELLKINVQIAETG